MLLKVKNPFFISHPTPFFFLSNPFSFSPCGALSLTSPPPLATSLALATTTSLALAAAIALAVATAAIDLLSLTSATTHCHRSDLLH
ncbi:hypothetical protein ACB092_11G014100 [Castanea dentata]